MIYSLLHILLLPVIIPWELRKRPFHKWILWLKEKFGLASKISFSEKKDILWVHAVSLGEVKAVSQLLKKLSSNFNILLTVITETGRTYGENLSREIPNLKIHYLPFDLSLIWHTFWKKINPKALILVETEIWPNLITFASQRVPVFLINARLSDGSFPKYHKLAFFFKPLLNLLTAICVQDEKYLHRFNQLGVKSEKLYLTGNLKFDLSILPLEFSFLSFLERPIVIAGSTHEPEEEMMLKLFLRIEEIKSLLLVPRHPERFSEVWKLCLEMVGNKAGVFSYSDLEKLKNNKTPILTSQPERAVILVDRVGILASLYGLADLAVIGGSFIPHGGQNPLEAIYWKVPVIVGPYMENFPFVEEFIREKAIIKVSQVDLEETIKLLLSDKTLRREIAERAYQRFQALSGSTERTLAVLKKFWP